MRKTTRISRPLRNWMLACAVMAAAGCAATSSDTPARPAPFPGPVYSKTQEAPQPAEGGLWTEDGLLGDLYGTAKARRVGDILTVRIVESSSATNKASTATDRSSALSAGVESFLNLEKGYGSAKSTLNPFGRIKGDITSQFDGNGTTERSGDLTAYISVRVVDVLANGNLRIAGVREVTVNHEKQWISLAGIVRPRDISADNIVQSTYISDAQIAYSGDGMLDDRQRPGWFTRIMDKVWPF